MHTQSWVSWEMLQRSGLCPYQGWIPHLAVVILWGGISPIRQTGERVERKRMFNKSQLSKEGKAENWGSWENTLQLTAQKGTNMGGAGARRHSGTTLPMGQRLQQGGTAGIRRLYPRQEQSGAERKQPIMCLSLPSPLSLYSVASITSAIPLSCDQPHEPQQCICQYSLRGQTDKPHQVRAEGVWAQQANAKHSLVWHILFLPKICTRSPPQLCSQVIPSV